MTSKGRVLDIDKWEDLAPELAKLRRNFDSNEQSGERLLYRGLGSSLYALETTLERYGRREMAVSEYCETILAIRPAIETRTGRSWNDLPDTDEVEALIRKAEDSFFVDEFPSSPLLSYMAYLRHHGFPSPLLDWSASPYVAAYFAFKEPPGKPTGRRD